MENATTALTQDLGALKWGGPPHLQEMPSHQWSNDQLSTYARECRIAIDSTERSTAVLYWRLGFVLKIARKQFKHGSWRPFLKQAGIDPTRASKAIAIRRKFSTEEQVADQTVEEACGRKRRKRVDASIDERRAARGPSLIGPQDFDGTLASHLTQVEGLPLSTLPRVTATEAIAMVGRLNALIERLIGFRDEMTGLAKDDFLLEASPSKLAVGG